jgi:hypothetical protein
MFFAIILFSVNEKEIDTIIVKTVNKRNFKTYYFECQSVVQTWTALSDILILANGNTVMKEI